MNIFKLEFKSTFKGLIVWSITVSLVLIMFLAFFPSMNTETMKQLVSLKLTAMPPFMMAAMGIPDATNFTDIFTNVIYYFGYCFQFIILAGAIYAALLGASSIIREESEGTIEFLYAQPVTRVQIVWQKLLATFSTYIIFCSFIALVSIIMCAIIKPPDSNFIDIITAIKKVTAGFILCGTIFICIGFAISTIIKSAKQATSIGIGIALLTYIIGMFSKMFSANVQALKLLKYLSPIDYASPISVLNNGFDIVSMIIAMVLILTSVFVAFQIYGSKDLKS